MHKDTCYVTNNLTGQDFSSENVTVYHFYESYYSGSKRGVKIGTEGWSS